MSTENMEKKNQCNGNANKIMIYASGMMSWRYFVVSYTLCILTFTPQTSHIQGSLTHTLCCGVFATL